MLIVFKIVHWKVVQAVGQLLVASFAFLEEDQHVAQTHFSHLVDPHHERELTRGVVGAIECHFSNGITGVISAYINTVPDRLHCHSLSVDFKCDRLIGVFVNLMQKKMDCKPCVIG
jgi:hypothetical protein